MAAVILGFILCIPLYGVLIWQIIKPKDAILWGRRWMYKEKPHVTENAVRYIKLMSIFALIFLSVIFIFLIFSET